LGSGAETNLPQNEALMDGQRTDRPVVGICCSGGGLRAACFSLGALQVSSGDRGSLSGTGPFHVWDWLVGDTVVDLKVVLESWRTGTSLATAPTWTVSTSVVDGPSQQLVFNIPGSFKIPGAETAPHGAPPAVMLTSFSPQGAYGYL
jgi:hypothetical protein